MSVLALPVLTLPGRPFAGVFGSLAGLFETVRVAYRASSDFSRLNTLSDRQLADVGIRREELPKMLFDQHFG